MIASIPILAFMLSVGPEAPSAFPPESAPQALKPAIEKANAAATALQKKLSTRLLEAMKQGGPPAAIRVCRDEAARLTEEAARESGVAVGRTSERLRNPRNAAPPWAAPYVAAAAGKRASEVQPVALDLGDRVAVLRPIALAQACTSCHGSRQALSPEIASVLASAYPNDKAVGYVEGDHRGFTWAVVAK